LPSAAAHAVIWRVPKPTGKGTRRRRLASELLLTAAELRAGLRDLAGLVDDLEKQARRVARAGSEPKVPK